MNRSSSFFISLIVHILLLAFAFILYRAITPSKEQPKRVPIKLSQCVVSSCTCKANENPKEEPKKVEQERVKPIKEPTKEEKKPVVEQKTALVQHSSSQAVMEEKIPKEPAKVVPKEPSVITQNTPQKPVQTESNTVASKEQVVKSTEAPKSIQQVYIQTNLAAIIAMLHENFYYPLSARKRGIQGEVVVKFTLCKNRDIKDIKISRDAPEILSKAAINTIESLSGKLPAPTEELVLELPIHYKLH